MRLSMILAIVRAEIRSIRRLFRYWTFAIVSAGLALFHLSLLRRHPRACVGFLGHRRPRPARVT